MPGFSIGGTGGDSVGKNFPNSTNEVRRTHRWLWNVLGPPGIMTPEICVVLKSASRPTLNIEEPVMHHNQEQVYYAGKHSWEAISLSWYDMEQPTDVSKALYKWINTVLIVKDANVELPSFYKKTAKLSMVDGKGASKDSWDILNCWPQNTNWNSLDYTSTELQLIEVKLRYDRAMKTDA